MSVIGKVIVMNTKEVLPVINTTVVKCDKNIVEKIEGVMDTVFNNMKKRGSYTDFRVDYPWLTI